MIYFVSETKMKVVVLSSLKKMTVFIKYWQNDLDCLWNQDESSRVVFKRL